jgi:hypothetical protein
MTSAGKLTASAPTRQRVSGLAAAAPLWGAWSETSPPRGACLGVENPAQIPERFNLVFDSGEPSRMARVVWRSATRIGVTFG